MAYGASATVILALALGLVLRPRLTSTESDSSGTTAATAEDEHRADRVELSTAALKAAGIETVEVAEREAISLITVTGTVEANQEKIQQATSLVSGRVERVNVVLGGPGEDRGCSSRRIEPGRR
jgi:hypothetical protein